VPRVEMILPPRYILRMVRAPRNVIFDFGGVLGLQQDPAHAAAMAALCRLPLERFRALYTVDRLELDRGTLPMEEYWKRIFAAAGVTPTADLVRRIEWHDAEGWSRVNHAVVGWARELRAAGHRTAILSNMPPDKMTFMRESGRFGWLAEFEIALFSCDFALVKPEPSFFRLCLERLGAAPGECLFLDDMPSNVEAARALGIHALLFRSAGEAAAELRSRWEIPVRGLEDGRYE
jgi:putative hydrolase of the HAD superfamily